MRGFEFEVCNYFEFNSVNFLSVEMIPFCVRLRVGSEALLFDEKQKGLKSSNEQIKYYVLYGEFDSGSERTLAAWIRHASRTGKLLSLLWSFLVANG